jgi:molybdopterin converting factor small subunit
MSEKESSMKVFVELNGMPREIAGSGVIEVDVPQGATYEGVVARLAKLKPELVGILIDRDGRTFLSSNMFIRNGDMAQPAMIMSENPMDGDRLTIISPITGG